MRTKPAEFKASNEPQGDSGAREPMMQPIFERLLEIGRTLTLEEMATGLSHEINQALGTIATYAQAGERMLNRPQPMIPQAGEVFKQITTTALDAGEDIRQIRKHFHRNTSNQEACSLPELLTELRPSLEILADRVQGALEISMDEGLPVISGDRLRIQYVLFTLVQNAFEAGADRVDAMPRACIKAHGDRHTLVATVEDSGPGIPPQSAGSIFQPFFTTKPQGAGLALAASRAIIEAHGGNIGFESAPGGTRFWFRLPAVEPQT